MSHRLPDPAAPAGSAASAPRCFVHPLAYRADPSAWFARIRHAPSAVLLDSGRPGAERGRFDILTAWPERLLQPDAGETGAAFFARLRQALAELGPAGTAADVESPFLGGLIGLFDYEFGAYLEPALGSPESGPAARVGLYHWALVSDHQQRRSQLIFHPACPGPLQQRVLDLFAQDDGERAPAPPFQLLAPFSADIDGETYRRAIGRIADYIRAGDCYQVNFAQRFCASYAGDEWLAYQALRNVCPTPFAGFLSLEDGALLSLSPERFLQVREGRVETRPIKGTRPRGPDAAADQAEARALLASDKDRAENLMIVDLLRNDLGRSCRVGSIRVPELFALESYPNVHHLVSSVVGELAPGKDALDLLAGAFPGGSITGAPKIRAMQIIHELEGAPRRAYCGSLFYLDVRGRMDSSITIRTLLARAGRVDCWGGGGIVMDSDWQAEYAESLTKVALLMRTLETLPQRH